MSIKDIRSYYNSQLNKRVKDFVYGNERVFRAYEEVYKLIKTYQPKRILEIGCGIGDVSFRLAEEFPDIEFVGFDISESTIEFGRNVFNLANLQLVFYENLKELDSFLKDQKFDFIFLIDVYEHFDDESIYSFRNLIKNRDNGNTLIFFSCPTINHQNYLRKHNPQGLQPIDRDVEIKDFLNLSEMLQLELIYYKVISVWSYSDYQHAVIGKLPDSGNFSDKLKVKKKGIKDLLKERIKNKVGSHSKYILKKEELKKYLVD
ncbi:class I SAM-dependent methyltransferase [Algoriphagus vanfongensis]|uniref:class I SAM-dependent methyltransferase n=1 Tax=Algoriphagus vanfongensis TaxID=426371 RepID=UPI000415448F|nr:class I SAM-dependent methyltransferase [Algoriphagus vanfongensis]